jgi:serine protease Do
MKKARFFAALALSLLILLLPGCDILPPPFITTTTTTPVTSTEVPASLEAAAERITPSVVIVDTPFATGTGWIYDSSGIIVTNYHVIEGARVIVVTLADGQRYNVRQVSSDSISDLAVLYIDATGLPAAAIGSSSSLKIGDPVVSVGNSNGAGISVKTGSVTHLNVTVGIENEQFYGLIENNAPIREGDSGGPLVNQNGEVIGISNAKVIGLEEISYAINIDGALPIIQQLIGTGQVTRAYLGITGRDNPSGSGVLIEDISPGSPAEDAGLQSGDIITAVDGVIVSGMTDLQQTIRSQEVGQSITITYRRGGVQSETTAVLIQYPTL